MNEEWNMGTKQALLVEALPCIGDLIPDPLSCYSHRVVWVIPHETIHVYMIHHCLVDSHPLCTITVIELIILVSNIIFPIIFYIRNKLLFN